MRLARLQVAAAGLLAFAACRNDSTPTDPTRTSPSLAAGEANQDSRIIVVFRADVTDPPGLARALAAQHGGALRFTYQRALKGFAGSFPAAALDGLSRHPSVAYIEPDAPVQLHATQANPPWGLDRIDQRDLPLSNSYTDNETGAGVTVYILDTGIRLSHNDFGGRAAYVNNGANGDFVGDGHGSAADCHGHGTHVAGTAAGTTYGVAKGATIRAARVVNCAGSGNVSMAIAAVDWVTTNATGRAVVNMSLGYGNVQSLRDAVEASVAAGINYAVSAGNGNFAGIPQDACAGSPAGAPSANTVGATASNDTEASFSNYGPCVDILAPGVGVLSAYYTSNTATMTFSGTSMSSPHVAGAVALYLEANSGATPAQVSQALKGNASLNKISLHRRSRDNGTANRLLFVGAGGGGTNNPPTAGFTFNCTGLTCSFTNTSTDDKPGMTFLWNFGDNTTSTQNSPSHTYGAANTYAVTLTATDSDNASDVASHSVTVSPGGGGGFTLSATGYKVKGVQHAGLTWSGGPGGTLDVYRNGAIVGTSPDDGAHTDNIGNKGGGSYAYRVCSAGGTSTCSNFVTVTF